MSHLPNGDREPSHGWVERREGPSVKLIAFGIAALLLLIFILQNNERAEADFLWFNGTWPIWTLLAGAAALGFVGGWAVGRMGWADRRARKAERKGGED